MQDAKCCSPDMCGSAPQTCPPHCHSTEVHHFALCILYEAYYINVETYRMETGRCGCD